MSEINFEQLPEDRYVARSACCNAPWDLVLINEKPMLVCFECRTPLGNEIKIDLGFDEE